MSKVNLPAILAENARRLAILYSPYNPVSGLGSPIPRFAFAWDDSRYTMLPVSMLDVVAIRLIHEAGGVARYCKDDPGMIARVTKDISNLRMDHDFEYWCFLAVKVQDKLTKQAVPFVLRKPQLKLLMELEDMRLATDPIRIILTKARQWGGSTLVQIYMSWMQIRLKTNWHSAICADVETQARNIRGMFSRMAANYPKTLGQITLNPYEGSTKVRVVAERGNIIGVGSMQAPDSLRSFDFSMLHLSEVGLWRKTEGKSPEDLVQSLRATVPGIADTLIVEESTAKGVGNFFHREWLQAVNGKSGYRPVFIGWQEIELYQRPVEDYAKLVNSMTEYQWFQWEQGATLEGINWYKTYQSDENFDDWRMQSEYPTTWQEAFQSTGRRAFAPVYVARTRKNCRAPEMVGDLFADAIKGPDCLKNIRFEEVRKGPLSIWMPPDPTPIKNRYAGFGDIGGRSPDADKSVLRIIDRYWMLHGGKPEFVATYRGNLDQDLFAWKAVQIAFWYNKALLAIETNSLKKDESEGDHFLTILDEIVDYYPNLFARTSPEQIKQGAPVKYGFHTNKQSKPMIIDRHNAAMRDEEYIEVDAMACDEADTYEIKEDGIYGAKEGCHDDIEVCTAGALWMALSHMDPVKVIDATKKWKGKTTVSEATL